MTNSARHDTQDNQLLDARMQAEPPIPIPLFKSGNGCIYCDKGDKPEWINGQYGHRWIDLVAQSRSVKTCTNVLLQAAK